MAEETKDRVELLDRIVGRCVRELEFGRRVLANPAEALSEYDLTEDELDDFRALSTQPEITAQHWRELHGICGFTRF